MRRHGIPEQRILTTVYVPFIVEGPATWSDSWHAPRTEGGFHLHEGQDVLCRYGAPVLAAVTGTVTFSTDPLGGLGAELTLPGGGFLYYAHLSKQSTALANTRVRPGTVIGRCGATGDATVPHVHFAWFDAQDVARDPMKMLVGFLHTAEMRVLGRTSAANLLAKLPPGVSLESPPPVRDGVASNTIPVQQAAGFVPAPPTDGGPGPWTMLALVLAILLPAAAMRDRRVRTWIRSAIGRDEASGEP